MNALMRLRLLLMVGLVSLVGGVTAGCGSGGGFHPKDTGTTALTGHILKEGGASAAGVNLFLISSSDERWQAVSGEDGRFHLDTLPAGAFQLVLNDGRGHGGLRRMNLHAGGLNDLGDLVLQPLRELPELVSTRGVGFEERLTQSQGDYESPLYRADGSAVFALRRNPFAYGYDVVRIHTDTGAEQVLYPNVRPSFNFHGGLASYAPPLLLIDDRVLALVHAVNVDRLELIMLDLKSGRELRLPLGFARSALQLPGDWYVPIFKTMFVSGDALFFVDGEVTNHLVVAYSEYRCYKRLVRVDLRSGEVSTSALLAGNRSFYNFNLFLHDKSQVVFTLIDTCSGLRPCSEQERAESAEFARHLFRVDLATLEEQAVVTAAFDDSPLLVGTWQHRAVLDGQFLFVLLQESLPSGFSAGRLHRIDLSGRTIQALAPDSDYEWIQRVPFQRELLAFREHMNTWGSGSTYTHCSLERVSLKSGQVSPIPLMRIIGENPFYLCPWEAQNANGWNFDPHRFGSRGDTVRLTAYRDSSDSSITSLAVAYYRLDGTAVRASFNPCPTPPCERSCSSSMVSQSTRRAPSRPVWAFPMGR